MDIFLRIKGYQPDGALDALIRFIGTIVTVYALYFVALRLYFRRRIAALRAMKKVTRLQYTEDEYLKHLLARMSYYLARELVLHGNLQDLIPAEILNSIPQVLRDYLDGIEIVEPVMFAVAFVAMLILIPKECFAVLPIHLIFPLNRIFLRKGTKCIKNSVAAIAIFKALDRLFGVYLSYAEYITKDRAQLIRSTALAGKLAQIEKTSVGRHTSLLKMPFAEEVFVE